jgi:ribosomal protein S18 acetylase RimI-like enzyme
MIVLDPITPRKAQFFKAVRLRALQDVPTAFGSTYAREVELADAEWTERAARWNSEGAIGLIAMDGSIACGLVASYLDPEDAAVAHLVSMWTAPTHRKQGIGRRLVEEVLRWGRRNRVRTVKLFVTSNNQTAESFYRSFGFSFTGRTDTYPNDPLLLEREMACSIK